jgi:predicted porin
MKLRQTIVLAGLGCIAAGASAQSSVTLYGTIDQYMSYLKSSSGTSVKALEDGAYLRTRFGLRGIEDLGGGYAAKFNFEGGVNADRGAAADTSRLFDRQAWVGVNTPYGEVRFGRQNGSAFIRGGYTDYTTRTLGSVINNFGVPSRFDNDIAYFSPKLFGALNFDLHYALAEQSATAGGNRQSVFQAGFDYTAGPVVVGYGGVRAKPAKTATQPKSMFYDYFFGNYDYGQGKVYLSFVRSNNSTVGSGTTAGVNNAGTLLGNVGGVVAGTDANANRTYNILQLSADYKITPALRVGGLVGRINDKDSSNDASGGSVGAYYDLSKRTTLYSLWHTLRNKGDQLTGAGFRPGGSAGIQSNFTQANDVNGRTINGLAAGILHRF